MSGKRTIHYLAPYIGGQIEVQNTNERYLYRGEISNIDFDGLKLQIGLNWLAKGEGFPPFPTEWRLVETKLYEISLEVYSMQDLEAEDGARLILSSFVTGEIAVLFLPEGSKLLKPVMAKATGQ